MSIRTTEQQTEHILGLLHTETVRRRERRKRTLRAAAALASFVIVCGGVWSFFGYRNLMQRKDGHGGAIQDGTYGNKMDADFDAPVGNGDTEPSGFDGDSAPASDMTKTSGRTEDEPPDPWDRDTGDAHSFAVCEDAYLGELLGEYDKLSETMPLFAAEVKEICLNTRRSGSEITFYIGKDSLQAPKGGLLEYLDLLGERSTLTVTGLPYTTSPEDGLEAAVTAPTEKMTVSEENGEILLTIQLETIGFSEGKPFFFLLRFWDAKTPGKQLLDCAGGWYFPM